ncbi:ScpA family protein [Parvularcula sp. LCG005]|uniref:segregation and condensation protein A n=1 Tax=Parvularcula sp. LCG005 TaxID=3078805 RepID=UPI002943C483|nr:ScpA family protein [Parvularcula sp. LCG005]WOI52431.1 ScpA family protein [Parvularcula sp. LCG005]
MVVDSVTDVEAEADPFDAPVRQEEVEEQDFIVRLDGYEGPLDMLLDMAQRQKVDLRHISVHALVNQYLEFIDEAKKRDLELAADYLVMAAWLTYLKSRLLLPVPKTDGEEPTADEMSARLAFQLQRLDAMRKASEELLARPQLGHDLFARPANDLSVQTSTEWTADLYDLLKAYSRQRVAAIEPVYHREAPKVFNLEAARDRLAKMLGDIPDWCLLTEIGADQNVDAPSRSVVASNFGAALEYAKAGKIELRQSAAFAPIYLRRHADTETPQ